MSKIEVVWQNTEKSSFKFYKLIYQFILFKYSCVHIRGKQRISSTLIRGFEHLKVRACVEKDRIAFQYADNRKRLKSKIKIVWQNVEKVSFKLCTGRS